MQIKPCATECFCRNHIFSGSHKIRIEFYFEFTFLNFISVHDPKYDFKFLFYFGGSPKIRFYFYFSVDHPNYDFEFSFFLIKSTSFNFWIVSPLDGGIVNVMFTWVAKLQHDRRRNRLTKMIDASNHTLSPNRNGKHISVYNDQNSWLSSKSFQNCESLQHESTHKTVPKYFQLQSLTKPHMSPVLLVFWEYNGCLPKFWKPFERWIATSRNYSPELETARVENPDQQNIVSPNV